MSKDPSTKKTNTNTTNHINTDSRVTFCLICNKETQNNKHVCELRKENNSNIVIVTNK